MCIVEIYNKDVISFPSSWEWNKVFLLLLLFPNSRTLERLLAMRHDVLWKSRVCQDVRLDHAFVTRPNGPSSNSNITVADHAIAERAPWITRFTRLRPLIQVIEYASFQKNLLWTSSLKVLVRLWLQWSFSSLCIKRIKSMLPWVCSVTTWITKDVNMW